MRSRKNNLATGENSVPWFMSQGFYPMAEMVPNGIDYDGTQKIKTLDVAKPYWRRRYKDRVLRRLNHASREVPSFDEVGLGDTQEVPYLPSVEKGIWGNLESLLSTAGSIWQKKETVKLEAKAAENRIKMDYELSKLDAPGTWTAVGLIVAAGIGYYALTRS